MKMLSLITHPHSLDVCSSSEHKLRYCWWNLSAFWPFLVLMMSLLGVRRSDIQDRYRFDIGIFCWIGVSVWWDRSKFITNIVLLLSPTKATNIKQHKVSVHYISSVLKPLRNLIWCIDEYLSQVHVNTSLRCRCPFSVQTACRVRLLESRR